MRTAAVKSLQRYGYAQGLMANDIAVLVQEFREAGVIRASVFLEQRCAYLWDLDLQESVFVAESFAAGNVIRAEPRVALDGGAVVNPLFPRGLH
jgi:hypothetical protein